MIATKKTNECTNLSSERQLAKSCKTVERAAVRLRSETKKITRVGAGQEQALRGWKPLTPTKLSKSEQPQQP